MRFKHGSEKQNEAFNYLFLAILQENGYYDKLRNFMRSRGYNWADMAAGLAIGYEKAPDGMSPYYYLDSLEDMLATHSIRGFNDISDMIDYVYNYQLWKE